MKPSLLVLAAGMGSRYGGIKQIEAVGPLGQIILEYSVFDALRAGFGKAVFVIRKDIEKEFTESVLKRFDKHLPVDYVLQNLDDLPAPFELPAGRTKPWGTAHAVRAARKVLKEPFAVINADDFYGRASFQILGNYLSGLAADSTAYSMVAYLLKNTLSEFGTVSRGVCKVDASGLLVELKENKKIGFDEKGKLVSWQTDGSAVPMSGEETVSMNFFGLTPKIFEEAELRFAEFLKTGIADEKSEFYIPLLLSDLVQEGFATMKVLGSDSPYFGITYKEDLPDVKKGIRSLIEAGHYPKDLWG